MRYDALLIKWGKEKHKPAANEVSTLWGKKDKKNIMFARIREKIIRR